MAAATKSGSGKERGALRRCTAKEKKEKIRQSGRIQAEDAARREERDEGI